MKKLFLTFSVVLLLTLIFGCKNDSEITKAEELFTENPVTISWTGENSSEIESFQTDVEVYSMNNRKETSLKKSNKYRLSLKSINGVQYSRIDMDAEYNGGIARSVITNDKECIIFNTNTEEIECRMPVEKSFDELSFMSSENGLSRINLDKIKTDAKRLAFDVTEENSESFCLSLPSELFNANENSLKRLSTKVLFDTINETLNEIEIVSIDDEGVTSTTTICPVYQETEDGTPVKVGMITVIDTQNPNKIEGFPEDYPIYESYDDIPEISPEDAEKMLATGSAFVDTDITFGDPSDLSSVETIVEKYESIEINKVDDRLFRLAM